MKSQTTLTALMALLWFLNLTFSRESKLEFRLPCPKPKRCEIMPTMTDFQ